jgi:hypothetical protein
MRCFRCLVGCSIVLILGGVGRGEIAPSPHPSPPAGGEGWVRGDPLHLLPDGTDIVVQTPQPRQLVETLLNLEAFKSLQQLAGIREVFESTTARRFQQLVAYFEKELGVPWPRLLDRLAGRGAVFGVKLGPTPAPVLLVVQGDDDKLMHQFFQLAIKIVEQELARQEAKETPVKGKYGSRQ